MRRGSRLAFISGVIFCSLMFCSRISISTGKEHAYGDCALEPFVSDTVKEIAFGEARKKKKDRYTFSIIVAALMVKAILFPLAFKAMAVMSSVAVLLSTMSLIATSIIGYTKLAWSKIQPSVKVVRNNDVWAKDDEIIKNYANEVGYYDTIGPVEEHLHYYQRK